MINGAKQIICNIPAKHLDPVCLAKSQPKHSTGMIIISYEQIAEESPTGNANSNQRFYDLLFLKGPTITNCARMNQDLRFKIATENSLQTFKRHRDNPGTSVSLYYIPEEIVRRFQLTFYYEPCLKVQIEALPAEQLAILLASTPCRRGVVEWNDFNQENPAIDLIEIYSIEQFATYRPAHEHGRLLLYDIQSNKEIIRELYSDFSTEHSGTPPGETEECQTLGQLVSDPPMAPPGLPTHSRRDALGHTASTHSPNPASDKLTTDDPVSPPPAQTIIEYPVPESRASEAPTGENPIEYPVPESPAPDPPTGDNPVHDPPVCDPPEDLENELTAPDSIEHFTAESKAEYVKSFKRLYDSFRELARRYFGDRYLKRIDQAQEKIRSDSPAFDTMNLTYETAFLVLELIAYVVNSGSFIKRGRIREDALTLMSQFHDQHYELLELHGKAAEFMIEYNLLGQE